MIDSILKFFNFKFLSILNEKLLSELNKISFKFDFMKLFSNKSLISLFFKLVLSLSKFPETKNSFFCFKAFNFGTVIFLPFNKNLISKKLNLFSVISKIKSSLLTFFLIIKFDHY